MSEILLIVGVQNDTFDRGIRLTLTCYNQLREELSDYIQSCDNTMQVLILRLLSMFLRCPGVPALESELTKFLCSVSSLHEAVHHKSDGSLWAVLSSAAEDAATW